jgi:predicted nucleic acid-binding protein
MTTIGEALTNVGRLGLDTSPIIYFIESHPEFGGRAADVFRKISSLKRVVEIPVIVLREIEP